MCHKVFFGGGGIKTFGYGKVFENLSKWYQNVAFFECSVMQVMKNVSRRKSASQGFCGGRGWDKNLWVLKRVRKTFKMVSKRCISRMESNASDKKLFQEEKGHKVFEGGDKNLWVFKSV